MKKYILSIAATALYILSAYADSITVADVSLSPDETQSVSINLTNTETNLVSFQMDLTLPEGITINKSGCSLSGRFPNNQELTIGRQSNGTIRLTSTSFNLTPIAGTSGEIITLSLTASADSEGGTATISNIRLVTSNSERITPADATFSISIASASPIITFADANVKAICVANWDTNHDGELSEAEATAVTDLGEAFRGNTTITSFNELQYFTSLTTIGNNAFRGSTALTSVTIPEGVTTIGNSAFRDSGLETIAFPNSLTSILRDAFDWCMALTSITIPKSVTRIDASTFQGCQGLTSIIVEEGNPTYDSRDNCNAIIETATNTLIAGCQNTIIPESVTSIGGCAFEGGCTGPTTFINIPEGVTSIWAWGFHGCGLTSVTIPNSVTLIDHDAFQSCDIMTDLTIGSGVTNIRNSAFSYCSALTDVWCYAENVPMTESDAFNNSPIASATLHVPAASLEAYSTTAPWSGFGSIRAIEVEYVTNLLSNKWSGAEYSVQAATFDSGVNYGNGTESNPNYNQIVGVPETDSKGRNWYEFDYTCNWQEMTAPLNNWCQGGNFGDIYARRTFYYDEEMPEELFLACGHDDAPCEYYLNGELIWSVTDGWFEQEIYKLTSAQKALLRPGELNVLAFHVHQNWGGMYADCGLYTSLSEMGISNKCGDNLIWSFNGETETLTISGTGDMYDFSDNSQTPWIGFKNSIKNLDVQSGVTRIGGNAFNGCTALSSVTISNSVTVVGSWAFCDCKSLTSITIPEGVINIRDNVFRNCTSLTSVSLPESLKTLGGHAFLGCRSLASITIPDGITFLDRIAFQECSSLTTFTYNKAENALTKVNGVYQIGTAEDLCNFAILSTAANSDISAQLTADIDYTGYTFPSYNIGEHFQHIGLNGYRGMFDGNGHTITVNINNPDSWQVAALFRELGKGGVIKNLRVAGHVESVSKFSAGIVSNLKSGKINHCVSDVDIVSHIDGDCTDGGIAGIATYDGEESIVEYCVVAGSFQGSNAHHRGGIIGIGYAGNSDNITIDNCLFLANVDGLDVTESGTFIRKPTDKTTINNCYYLNVLGTVTSGTQTTTAQMTSGELCFLLNGNQSNINWTQNLTGTDADTYPLPFSTHAQVYAYDNTYSNTDLSPVITFADANVKALCVANWDTNGDGELSEAEAAAVTDLGEVFRGNTTITSFNELQYFTSLTTIGNNAFDGCTGLTSIAIPTSLNRVKTGAFKNCTSLSKVIVTDIAAWCGIIYDQSDDEWAPLGTFPLGYALHLYSDENTEITEVVIPDGVTRIEPLAFRDAKYVTSVTIPNSVTYIGAQAFRGMHRLTSIIIPQDVTSIEKWTFNDCQSLTSVTIPEGVIDIGNNAFNGCISLTSVPLPESLKYIWGAAFSGCSNLTSITIPDGIIQIDRIAFVDCPNLTSLTYNKAENALTKVDGVYQIGTAEDLCNFTILSTAANTDICAKLTADIDYTGYTFMDYTLSDHFRYIGLNNYCGTFDGNGHTITVNINNPYTWDVAALFRIIGRGGVIKNLRVAGHVESVSKFSAGIVSNLKSGKVSHCVSDVDIVSHIDGDCTDGGIAGIATYDGEESIVEYCVVAGSFQGSNAHHRGGIIGIGYAGNSDNITIDNCLFLANVDGLDVTESGTFIRKPTDKTTINNCYYLNVLGTVTSGTQTTTAQMTSGELCFLLNGNQSSINWTQNLTGTDADTYPLPFSTHAQVYAYDNTYSNTDLSPVITFADANVKALCVANWDTNGDGELSEAEAAAVADLGEVFRGNTTITSFNELQYFTSLTTIGDNAFRECTALTSVTIPEGVQHIGYWAFCESGLTSITLPEGITNFCNAVFAGCRSLTSVEWPSDMTEIADYTFYQCSSLTSIHIPDGVTTIGHSAFRESGLESIAFPNSVTNIGSYVFDDCDNLTSVTMPASVITFDENEGNAFGQSNNIEAVYISDLTAWLGTSFPNANNPLRSGAKLYLNNVEVKDLVIPEGTTAILKAAFEGCESLTSVSIPNSVTSIDGWAFAKCNNLTSATIPESVTSIGDHLFAYCSSLSSVTIPSSVTCIGNYAFADCGCLTGISVPNSVTSIGEGAFWGCAVATSINIPENLTSIEPYVFFNCPSLTSFTIPNGVTNVGELAFEWCNMTDVYCYAENVPNTNSNAFENSSISTATLHVPAASLEAYSTTAPWSGFGTIVAIEEEVGSNAIACADITAYSGHKVELPIMVTNDADLTVVGISFTLTLPEGVTVAKDEYGDPLYSLESTRLNPKRFNVYTNQYADGSWGFCISPNNTTAVLNGTEGEFMTITLDIADGMEEGDYNVCLMENKLSVRNSDNNIASKVISDSVSKLTINNVIMGDVNGDGEVDLSDAIMVTYYSLHVAPANFIEAVADVNGDGEIDLSDAITIIYKSLGVQ